MTKKSAQERKQRAAASLEEQQRRERRRTGILLVVCALVVIGLVVAALVPYIKDQRRQGDGPDTAVGKIGASASQAACRQVRTRPYATPASGSNHVPNGTTLTYPESPPADGLHWASPMAPNQYRSFYSPRDRPAKELLVHSLEHGYTVIWYDETIAVQPGAISDLKALATRYPPGEFVVVAPWTAKDGARFPTGHVALTHWTGPENPAGVWQYCGKPSGQVIQDFVSRYPKSNSPEPDAG